MQWIKIAGVKIALRLNADELEKIYIQAIKNNRTVKEEVKEMLETSLSPKAKKQFDRIVGIEDAKALREIIEKEILEKIEKMAAETSLTKRGKPKKYAKLSTIIKDIVSR